MLFSVFLALPAFAQQPSATPTPTPSASARPAPRAPSAPAPAADEDRSRSTPRRSLSGFLRAARDGDYEKASRFLDLRGIPRSREKREGPELAAMLLRVLEWRVELDADALPDEPSLPNLGADGVVIDVAEIAGESHVLSLVPVRQPDGSSAWLFSRETVAAVRPIHDANERRWLEERVPEWMKRRTGTGLALWQWLGLVALALVAYGAARAVGAAVIGLVVRLLKPRNEQAADMVGAVRRPLRLLLAAFAFEVGVGYLLLPATAERVVERGANILYIAAGAWAVIALVRVGTLAWEKVLPEDTGGLHRGLRTRLTMMRRIVTVLVGIVAVGLALLQFEVVRSVGLSLLASAGILGVLVGFAAQRTLGGIIAGIEMSITQPIRIGDMVEFEKGDLGVVEHIYFTYVVVRLRDDRRQIVPVTRVMAAPFINWTRSGLDVLVRVELLVDHAAPIDQMRAAFLGFCKEAKLWDKRIARVDVVETTDRAARLVGIASVRAATDAYDLACHLRERWLVFVQQLEGGKYLVHGRIVPPPTTNSPDSVGAKSEDGAPEDVAPDSSSAPRP